MDIRDQFAFLTENTKEMSCHAMEESKDGTQWVYRYHFYDNRWEGYRGLIGIPKDETKSFWFRFFEKGNSLSYQDPLPLELLPEDFQAYIARASDIVERRDRLRKLFIKKTAPGKG